MTQLVLAEELVKMGIIRFNLDNFLLNGVSYSRSASFSQRVQIAAERMCEEYQKQGMTCLLVKDGIMLTLWLSQPFKTVIDAMQTSPSSPTLQPQEELHLVSQNQDTFPQISSQEDAGAKVMIYRGNIYRVGKNPKSAPGSILKSQSNQIGKRYVYRGLAY